MPEVPQELLDQLYVCSDCAAETGGDGLRPGSEFPWSKAPKYKHGLRRGAYCKRHQSLRSGAANAKRLANAPKDGEVWQKKRAAEKRYRERRGTGYLEIQRERMRAYRKRHPDRARASVAAWAEKNRAKRKESQDAYVARRRLRGVRPLRARRPEEGGGNGE